MSKKSRYRRKGYRHHLRAYKVFGSVLLTYKDFCETIVNSRSYDKGVLLLNTWKYASRCNLFMSKKEWKVIRQGNKHGQTLSGISKRRQKMLVGHMHEEMQSVIQSARPSMLLAHGSLVLFEDLMDIHQLKGVD